MSNVTNTLPIVGAHFRPPAKALLAALPVGTALFIQAEPDNAYDPNAIAVYLESVNIPDSAHGSLDEALPSFGFSLGDIFAQEIWHLGYIPKEMAAVLRSTEQVNATDKVEVSLSFNAAGAPRIRRDEPFII